MISLLAMRSNQRGQRNPAKRQTRSQERPRRISHFFLCACSFIVLCEIDMNLCTIVQHEREAISGAPRKVLHTIQRPPFAVSARLAQFVSANLCLIGELGLRSFHVASSAFVMAAGFEKVFSRWKNISRARLVSPRRSHISSP